MTTNQIAVIVAAILGFLLLLAGSLGYMKAYALDETLCYVLMGIGIVMVIVALALVSFKKDLFIREREE